MSEQTIEQLLAGIEEQHYNWVQHGDAYQLEIFNGVDYGKKRIMTAEGVIYKVTFGDYVYFTNTDKFMDAHRLDVDGRNSFEIRPFTKEQINQSRIGPSERTLTDGFFRISRYDMTNGYEPVFQAYFLGEKFKYGSEHKRHGYGGISDTIKDFRLVEEFRARLYDYFHVFNAASEEQFRAFFTKSNLPEPYRNTIRELIII